MRNVDRGAAARIKNRQVVGVRNQPASLGEVLVSEPRSSDRMVKTGMHGRSSVDTEGNEREVLSGLDFSKHRPTVIIAEAKTGSGVAACPARDRPCSIESPRMSRRI